MVRPFSSAVDTDCPAISLRHIIVSLDLFPAVRTDIFAFPAGRKTVRSLSGHIADHAFIDANPRLRSPFMTFVLAAAPGTEPVFPPVTPNPANNIHFKGIAFHLIFVTFMIEYASPNTGS